MHYGRRVRDREEEDREQSYLKPWRGTRTLKSKLGEDPAVGELVVLNHGVATGG
jgi:hypothetical protein